MKTALYASFFGFAEEPFNITPDPKFLYLDERYREALAHLEYGVTYGKGFVLLTGEVGTGKTTLLNALLDKLPRDYTTAFVFSTTMSFAELLKMIHEDFSTGFQGDSEASLLIGLNRFLVRQFEEGKNSVLVFDEAQNLDVGLLEKIRLLSNLEARTTKLLQIVLSGQPELMDKLAEPSLRQLNQRIAVRFALSPLTREETNHYIDHRLSVAESRGQVSFTDEAIDLIHAHSQGIPRLINIVCGNSLLLAFGAGKREIDGELVREVVADLTRQTPRLAAVARQPGMPRLVTASPPEDPALSSRGPAPWGAQPRQTDSVGHIAHGEPPAPSVLPSRISSPGPLASPGEQPWTLVEAAAYLRISVGLVRRLLRSGEIRGRRVGRTWRVLRQELDRYVSGDVTRRNGGGDPEP